MPAILTRLKTAWNNATDCNTSMRTSSKADGVYVKVTKVGNSFLQSGSGDNVELVRIRGGKEVWKDSSVALLPCHKKALKQRLDNPRKQVSLPDFCKRSSASADEFRHSEAIYCDLISSSGLDVSPASPVKRSQFYPLITERIDVAIRENKLNASQRQLAINVVGETIQSLQKQDESEQKRAIYGYIATRIARVVDNCCAQPENKVVVKQLEKKKIARLTDVISKYVLDNNGLYGLFSSFFTEEPVSGHYSDPLVSIIEVATGIIETAAGIAAHELMGDKEFIACCANTVMCTLLSTLFAQGGTLSEKVGKTICEVENSMNNLLKILQKTTQLRRETVV